MRNDRDVVMLRRIAFTQVPATGHAGFTKALVTRLPQTFDQFGNPCRIA